jgi:hypothetical protein
VVVIHLNRITFASFMLPIVLTMALPLWSVCEDGLQVLAAGGGEAFELCLDGMEVGASEGHGAGGDRS